MRTFEAGNTILAEAEDSVFLGIVMSGILRVQRTMADGRQQIVGLLLPADFFGRVFERTSGVAVEAATDVTLCCFERHAFERLLSRSPELEHQMFLAVLRELDAARDWMLLLGSQTIPERVASFFLILHRRTTVIEPDMPSRKRRLSVHVPISRHDMAAYLGTTVETISRVIQDMSRRGIIEIHSPQHFGILDEKRLVRCSGREELSIGHRCLADEPHMAVG
ncbi:Crp/Fnr family transcriptional regulator [Mesorhizobium tianshanense]|nr:Crp/Fnr family transcriptional regulator [Mesorhizobium tianshanense]